jgi:hypothetical protein
MLLKPCLNCKYHEITSEFDEEKSRCLKENCYARFSKCIAQKALETFLNEGSSRQDHPFSAIEHLYSQE